MCFIKTIHRYAVQVSKKKKKKSNNFPQFYTFDLSSELLLFCFRVELNSFSLCYFFWGGGGGGPPHPPPKKNPKAKRNPPHHPPRA